MERRRAPATEAGHYVLHDFRSVDWDAWQNASDADRSAAIEAATEFLETAAQDGEVGCYSVLGHKADLLFLVLRDSMAEIDTFERQFAQLDLASYLTRPTSAIGVTEASGYTEVAADFFDPDAEADPGIERYMNARLYPSLPDAEFVSFYFMNKRRGPEDNWYDLPYDERAAHVSRHGEIGKEYAGQVTQLITGTMGFDDYEWGVTLFAEDMVAIKELLTDMRFDPSTSRFAEFGPFYVARRFPITDVDAFLAGQAIPTETDTESVETDPDIAAGIEAVDLDPTDGYAVVAHSSATETEIEATLENLRENFDHYDTHEGTAVGSLDDERVVVSCWATERAVETAAGFVGDLPGVDGVLTGPIGDEGTSAASTGDETADDIRSTLEEAGIYAGQPHGEDVHALVLYSDATIEELSTATSDLADGFDRYDTHRGTDTYVARDGDGTAVVSRWDTEDAASTAASYLEDLPGIRTDQDDDGFATMGMFYRVKPDHRVAFLDTFEEVRETLGTMDGHRRTELFINNDEETDMFIASRWDDRESAVTFFRSDAFRDTVQWGRDILADRPRHVFFV